MSNSNHLRFVIVLGLYLTPVVTVNILVVPKSDLMSQVSGVPNLGIENPSGTHPSSSHSQITRAYFLLWIFSNKLPSHMG